MTTAKRRNSDIFLEKIPFFMFWVLNSALLLDSSRTRGRLAFILVVWIDGKFIRSFGNGNSFAVRNWTESGWYIRIHYCPLFSSWSTEVVVSCVISWLPPNHRNSKRHRVSFVIQPLRKICCTFTAAYVWGPGFILVADLASEIKMIRFFHYCNYGLSLSCKCHFTANVTKVICTINTDKRYD
jgi:hypothetical protein